jgi:hypothetical protein
MTEDPTPQKIPLVFFWSGRDGTCAETTSITWTIG